MKPRFEDQNNILRRQVFLLTCCQEGEVTFKVVTWRYRLDASGDEQQYLFST